MRLLSCLVVFVALCVGVRVLRASLRPAAADAPVAVVQSAMPSAAPSPASAVASPAPAPPSPQPVAAPAPVVVVQQAPAAAPPPPPTTVIVAPPPAQVVVLSAPAPVYVPPLGIVSAAPVYAGYPVQPWHSRQSALAPGNPAGMYQPASRNAPGPVGSYLPPEQPFRPQHRH